MIQKMNKYSFLVYHREYEEFLLVLREFGVVHITERKNPKEQAELRALLEQRARLLTLERIVRSFVPEEINLPLESLCLTLNEGEVIASEIEKKLELRNELKNLTAQKKQEVSEQSVWGYYDVDVVDRLRTFGYGLAFYSVSTSSFTDEYKVETEGIEISRRGSTLYFVRLEREGSDSAPEAERIKAPEKSLKALEAELDALEVEQMKISDEIRVKAPEYIRVLKAYDHIISDIYTLGAARLQAVCEADDKLMILEGWVPSNLSLAMEQMLEKSGYYYQELDIVDEDKIPILLKNNFFARLFEPITEMFSMPNYREIDQTALFAPFFLLFFGLCFGDGGYGLLLFILATIYKLRSKDANSIVTLLQWLGGGAFIVGMLMGSFFGVTLGYAKAEDYFLNQDNLMTLSIILGLIQIFFAKAVAAYKIKVQRGLKYSLASFSWIFLLIAIGVLISLPMMAITLPSFMPYIIYGVVGVTATIVLFYNTPGKNPILNVGSALWTAYNTASGLLGDTLSYIRLFAIGLTGGILGSVFNQLAIEQTEGLPWVIRIPLMLIVLLVGHGLNIGLAMISSFVHPLRLTFVEYYKNSEFEGGGKAYTPLKNSI